MEVGSRVQSEATKAADLGEVESVLLGPCEDFRNSNVRIDVPDEEIRLNGVRSEPDSDRNGADCCQV